MLPGLFFAIWRFWEIITLIPTVGMLAWFVDGYNSNNVLTPIPVLVLFIVSTLALVWAILTIIMYGKTKRSGYFIALVDILFFGAFIAAVYELRGIASADCSNFGRLDNPYSIFLRLGPFGYAGVQTNNSYAANVNKNCSMLKASFAFGIMNVVFFFFSAFIALWIHHKHKNDEPTYMRAGRSRSGSHGHTVYEERTIRSSSRGGNTHVSKSHHHSPRHYQGSRRSSRSHAVI